MLKINSSLVSLNFDAREPGSCIEYIVLHYTACDFDLSVEVLTDATAENPVSAHYLIDEQGELFHMVPEAMRAWHAGVSYWQGKQGLNTWSLGIEMVNLGDGPYAEKQLQSCLSLCKSLMQKYAIAPENVIGHSDVAPDRKADPGEHFDWQGFAAHGVGIYPRIVDPVILERAATKMGDIAYVQRLLHDIGYKITCDGILGQQTKTVITAFQRHFYPQKVDGEVDEQLLHRMRVVCSNFSRSSS